MMHSLPADPVKFAPQTEVGDFAHAAYRALLVEVNLTPKPGLVDRHNNGAHRDMNLGHFYRSARAIGIWLPRFVRQGRDDALRPARRTAIAVATVGAGL